MSISVKLIFQFYTELELLKVAADTIDPTPTLLGLKEERRKLLRSGALYIARDFWNYKGPKKQLGAVLHS